MVTPPKCGTTWTQELAWLVTHSADTASVTVPLTKRSPWVESPLHFGKKEAEVEKYLADVEAWPSPRVIKTHLPLELLPSALATTGKVIFVFRNVRDQAVSYYHHERLFAHNGLKTEQFTEYARQICRPGLQAYGDYWAMLGSCWARRNQSNVLFLWYEEIKADQSIIIRQIARLAGVKLTDEQVEDIDQTMQFSNYQQVSTVNQADRVEKGLWLAGRGQFVRKGEVGDHVNHFTPELTEEWNLWCEESLDKLGIKDQRVQALFFGSPKSTAIREGEAGVIQQMMTEKDCPKLSPPPGLK